MRAPGRACAGSTYTARRERMRLGTGGKQGNNYVELAIDFCSLYRAYLADSTLSPCLLMPKLLIFDSSVCRGLLSFAAAPERPETLPCVSAHAPSVLPP